MKRIAWAAALLACLFCLPGKAGAVELSVAGKSALLMDVSTAFSTTKTNIRGLTVKTTADGFALISATVQVADKAQLDQVMTRLHQISGIIKVSRPAG